MDVLLSDYVLMCPLTQTVISMFIQQKYLSKYSKEYTDVLAAHRAKAEVKEELYSITGRPGNL